MLTCILIVYLFSSPPTDILPIKEGSGEQTREFLHRVVDLLIEWIVESNDRSKKILEFQQPEELFKRFPMELPEQPQNLGAILDDCKKALDHQVPTGKWKIEI